MDLQKEKELAELKGRFHGRVWHEKDTKSSNST